MTFSEYQHGPACHGKHEEMPRITLLDAWAMFWDIKEPPRYRQCSVHTKASLLSPLAVFKAGARMLSTTTLGASSSNVAWSDVHVY